MKRHVAHAPLVIVTVISMLGVIASQRTIGVQSVMASNHTNPSSHWREVTDTSFPSLYDIQLLSSTSGWAIGDASDNPIGATVLNWDGRSWRPMPAPGTSIDLFNADLHAFTDNDVWIGENALHHWDGISWSEIDTKGLIFRIYELDGVSGTDFWMLGMTAAVQPVFIHMRDGQVTSYAAPPPLPGHRDVVYYAIDMLSPIDGWAVGRYGAIAHWDGTAWSRVETPSVAWLYDVDFRTPSDGWAVGSNGTVLHWDGGSWTTASSPVRLSVIAVAAAGDNDVWVAYDAPIAGATLLGHWDGRSWTQSESPTPHRIEDLDVIDGTGFAAAAQRGSSTDMKGALLMLNSR